MIVWQGKGIVTPVIFILSLYFILFIFEREHDPLLQTTSWIWALTFFLTAVVSYTLGKNWRETQEKALLDTAAGKEAHLKTEHTFLWIDVMYWGYIYGVFGIIATICIFFK